MTDSSVKPDANSGNRKHYATAKAFRTALEERLRQQSRRDRIDLQRLRRRVAFERFLARLFEGDKPVWLLKGGYSLELRLHNIAWATVDIDLSVPTPNAAFPPDGNQLKKVREQLQIATEHDPGDWFTFALSTATPELQGPPEGGIRFSVQANLDNRLFAQFHADIGIGDVLLSEPDWITGSPLLDFAGIAPPRVAALPIAQHFAEKVHAYTLPRTEATNTRVKDLVDLELLIDTGSLDSSDTVRAIQATFQRRNTHEIPRLLPVPPDSWRERYDSLAAECGVSAQTAPEAYEIISFYWEMVSKELFAQ